MLMQCEYKDKYFGEIIKLKFGFYKWVLFLPQNSDTPIAQGITRSILRAAQLLHDSKTEATMHKLETFTVLI